MSSHGPIHSLASIAPDLSAPTISPPGVVTTVAPMRRNTSAPIGAEVLRRMGATVVTTPGGEIVGALKSGAIDASEWVGPWLDLELGLDKAADYYYYPGFHEPGTNSTLGITKKLWDGLTASERALI